MTGTLAAAVLLLAQEGPPDERRPVEFPREAPSINVHVELFTSFELRPVGALTTFSLEMPGHVAFREFSLPVTLGTPKRGLTYDALDPRLLTGIGLLIDFNAVRLRLERHEGTAERVDFAVANPTAGNPDGLGSLGWDLSVTRLAIDRPLVTMQVGSLGLMVSAGAGVYNISAKPYDEFYEVDIPPPTTGFVYRRREEWNGFFARIALTASVRIVGPLYFWGEIAADGLALQARGTLEVANFGLFLYF